MATQAFVSFTQARRPSLARLLAVLIIVLSVSGTGLAAFMLTQGSVVTRQAVSHAATKPVRPPLTSTRRPRRRPHR
ncbi:MAG TPA: hypothetical protein VG321_04595 [Solirubrobacteraceae bacterium]|jgi:hypothetical protein|nr:hypothetical protein [Solirubrobacteraceae bacterium]